MENLKDNKMYLRNVTKRMKDLPQDHKDRRLFCLEQARIRMGDVDNPSYLENLVEKDWWKKYDW